MRKPQDAIFFASKLAMSIIVGGCFIAMLLTPVILLIKLVLM